MDGVHHGVFPFKKEGGIGRGSDPVKGDDIIGRLLRFQGGQVLEYQVQVGIIQREAGFVLRLGQCNRFPVFARSKAEPGGFAERECVVCVSEKGPAVLLRMANEVFLRRIVGDIDNTGSDCLSTPFHRPFERLKQRSLLPCIPVDRIGIPLGKKGIERFQVLDGPGIGQGMGVVEHERQAVNLDFPFPREGHEKGVINQPIPDAIKQDPSVNAAVVGMDQRSAQVLVSLRVRFHRQVFFPKIRECGIRTMVLSKTNESFSVFDERWKKICVFCVAVNSLKQRILQQSARGILRVRNGGIN